MFRNREDAGLQLAERLRDRPLRDPVVLAIPRGGVAVGAVLARQLGADLDVVLSRKLRAPEQPELAIGAICEDGQVSLNHVGEGSEWDRDYLVAESRRQLAEIARRKKLIRGVLPRADVRGRSVIITDDGIATGSTIIAALKVIRSQDPHELIVAVPVASPDRLQEVKRWCDDVVCLHAPHLFWGIGQFYEDFSQVEDDEVVELLRPFGSSARPVETGEIQE